MQISGAYETDNISNPEICDCLLNKFRRVKIYPILQLSYVFFFGCYTYLLFKIDEEKNSLFCFWLELKKTPTLIEGSRPKGCGWEEHELEKGLLAGSQLAAGLDLLPQPSMYRKEWGWGEGVLGDRRQTWHDCIQRGLEVAVALKRGFSFEVAVVGFSICAVLFAMCQSQ